MAIKPFALQLFYDDTYNVCQHSPFDVNRFNVIVSSWLYTDGVEIVLLCVTHANDNKDQCVRSIDIY